MSTVMEVIAAKQCGFQVAGLSAISNKADGGPDQQPDTIEEVLEISAMAGKKILTVLPALIQIWSKDSGIKLMTDTVRPISGLFVLWQNGINHRRIRGIGAAIAKRFCEAGASLILHARKNTSALADLAVNLEAQAQKVYDRFMQIFQTPVTVNPVSKSKCRGEKG